MTHGAALTLVQFKRRVLTLSHKKLKQACKVKLYLCEITVFIHLLRYGARGTLLSAVWR